MGPPIIKIFVLFLIFYVANCQDDACDRDNVLNYLRSYGYMPPASMKPNVTDEDIKGALRMFQMFVKIEMTGDCDATTKIALKKPRCGCEDVIKDADSKFMPRPVGLLTRAERDLILGPQEYRLGTTKWTERELKWKITKYSDQTSASLTEEDQKNAFAEAFALWAEVTPLRFRYVDASRSREQTHIEIRFERRRHPGPADYPFDGPGNVLAHAFFPTSGVVHFDDDETWVLGAAARTRGSELFIVAAHEFGHTLGLSHSEMDEALMAPFYAYTSERKLLHADDVRGVQTIYGSNPVTYAPRPLPTRGIPVTTTPRPTRPPAEYPECKTKFDAVFTVKSSEWTTYVLSNKRYGRARSIKVTKLGQRDTTEMSMNTLFQPRYPSYVDAATSLPGRRGETYVYLFTGARAWKYQLSGNRFNLLRGYPKWYSTREFPERPKAAIAMPYRNHNAYYTLIFGKTMMWDWHPDYMRVSAWAYPLNVLGYNMPTRIDAATLQRDNYVYFFRGTKYYKFNTDTRRVEGGPKDIAPAFIRGRCGMAPK